MEIFFVVIMLLLIGFILAIMFSGSGSYSPSYSFEPEMIEKEDDVHCFECGVRLIKEKAQQIQAEWGVAEYYCDRHKKPYDRINYVPSFGKYMEYTIKYYKEFEVDKKGKLKK